MIEIESDDGILSTGYSGTISGVQWYKVPSPHFVCGEFGAHKLTCGHYILDLKYLLCSNPSTTSPCGLNCTTCSIDHEAWKCSRCIAEIKTVFETKLTAVEKMRLEGARKAVNTTMVAIYTTEFAKKYTQIQEIAELMLCVLDEKYGRKCEVSGEPGPVKMMPLDEMLEKTKERNGKKEKGKEKGKEKPETVDAETKTNSPNNPPPTPNEASSAAPETDDDIPIQHPNEQPSRSLALKRLAHFNLPPSPLLVERGEAIGGGDWKNRSVELSSKKRKLNPRLRLGDSVRWNGLVGAISERKRRLAIEAGDEEDGSGGWDAVEVRDRERARKKMLEKSGSTGGDGDREVAKKVGEWGQDDYPVKQEPLRPVYYEEDELL